MVVVKKNGVTKNFSVARFPLLVREDPPVLRLRQLRAHLGHARLVQPGEKRSESISINVSIPDGTF